MSVLVSPELTAVHEVPLLDDKNTPLLVPAKMFDPLKAIACILEPPVIPVDEFDQDVPSLVDKYIPGPAVPENMFEPLIAIEDIVPYGGPAVFVHCAFATLLKPIMASIAIKIDLVIFFILFVFKLFVKKNRQAFQPDDITYLFTL